jgi:hypothetical protein
MPKNDPSEADNDLPRQIMTPQRDSPAAGRDIWLLAWLGTALAGGAFGLLVVVFKLTEGAGGDVNLAVSGLVVGFIIATIVAAPVVATAAMVSWALGPRWLRPFLAILAGGVVGLVSMLLSLTLLLTKVSPQDFVFVALAGVAGAAGSGMAMCAWAKKYKPVP